MEQSNLLVGWREWAKLPELDIPLIKVKIDTGARTSALHAYDVTRVKKHGKDLVSFVIHPIQKNDLVVRSCIAEIVDIRTIKSSNGLSEERIVISTPIQIADKIWIIDVTLTNRDIMRHRMLLGRSAMDNILVDPSVEFCQGKITRKKCLAAYDLDANTLADRSKN